MKKTISFHLFLGNQYKSLKYFLRKPSKTILKLFLSASLQKRVLAKKSGVIFIDFAPRCSQNKDFKESKSEMLQGGKRKPKTFLFTDKIV